MPAHVRILELSLLPPANLNPCMAAWRPLLTRMLLFPGAQVLSAFDRRMVDGAQTFWEAVYSDNATKARRSAARKLEEFFTKRGTPSWPFTDWVAVEYATFLATIGKTDKGVSRPLAYATVLQYCGFAAQQHALQFLYRENPFDTPVFRLFVHQGIHRVIGAPVLKARPVTLRDLLSLAEMVAADPTPRHVTVLFCALLAFHCALRIANVIAEAKAVVKELFSGQQGQAENRKKARSLVCAKHLFFHDGGLVVMIPAGKTDQFKERLHRVLVPPFDALPQVCLVRAAKWFLRVVNPAPEAPVCMFSRAPKDMLTRSYFTRVCRQSFGVRLPGLLQKDTQRAHVTLESFRRGWMLLACHAVGGAPARVHVARRLAYLRGCSRIFGIHGDPVASGQGLGNR
jgi:hypothetical protein